MQVYILCTISAVIVVKAVDRDAIWDDNSDEPKEPCIRWWCRSPREWATLGRSGSLL